MAPERQQSPSTRYGYRVCNVCCKSASDQDMMDELLQSVYPVYSIAREFSNPYTVSSET